MYKQMIKIYSILFLLVSLGLLLLELTPKNLYFFNKWVHISLIIIIFILLAVSLINLYVKRKTMTYESKQLSIKIIIISMLMWFVVHCHIIYLKQCSLPQS